MPCNSADFSVRFSVEFHSHPYALRLLFHSDFSYSDDQSPEALVEHTLLRECLENALAVELQPLERDIVRLRHGLDDGKSRTIKEVMESCGGMLSFSDVRSVESRAYKKLRFKHSIHNARLRDFAEDYLGISPELLEAA